MKNNKLIKIISLVLSLVLIVSSATALFTSAEADTEVTPEVISKNASFDDNIHLYFAVAAEGIEKENISLKVYSDAEGTVELQTPRAPEAETENVHGTECYIFRTLGIAPKNADSKIYVQAVNTVGGTEYKGDIVEYSVLDYLYEMLYKDGFIEAKSGIALTQKNLYLSTLEYCAYAQDFFINYKDNDSTNDVPLFTDYAYVAVKDGTVDGKKQATYLKSASAEVTLATDAATAGMIWEVTEYEENGLANISEVELDPSGETKINITTDTVVKLVSNIKGTLRFNTADSLNDTSKIAMKAGTTWENGRIKITADGTGTVTERLRVYPTGTNTGKSVAVFEADVSIDYSSANASQPNGIFYLSPLAVTTSGSTAVGTKICLQLQSSKTQANVYLNGVTNSGSALVGEQLDFKIRYTYEYSAENANAVCTLEILDLDGNTLQSVTTTSTNNIKSPDDCLTFEMCANSSVVGTLYIDNVAFYQR